MLIKRLYLRNFRVYEDELDLELPPGLVGIYGPNGAGKSTLLEAILFTLWGKARTTKELIRSAGVGGDCVTEVEFEHEGHLYLVRRKLKGINSTVSVEAHCDGALMSTGTRDAERYVESVLGMDDGAFRASVFTEQKQLAAFSNQSPAERRKLVLQLLGITPLDVARDTARKDARQMASDHERLRGMLPDLEVLRTDAADSAARADAAEVVAAEEEAASGAARQRADAAVAAFGAEDLRRQEHDALVLEGRAARQEMDLASQAVDRYRQELAELEGLQLRLAGTEQQAAGLADDERRLELLGAAATAARTAEAMAVPARPEAVDEAALERAGQAAATLREEAAAAAALLRSAQTDLERARQALDKTRSLSGEAVCPTCGQALGDAFETVQAHRRSELDEAEGRCRQQAERSGELRASAEQATAIASELSRRAAESRSRMSEWEHADRRRRDALDAAGRAWQDAVAAGAGCWLDSPPGGAGEPPTAAALAAAVAAGRTAVEAEKAAATAAQMIRGRLEARPGLEKALAASLDQSGAATGRVEALRDKVRALGFRREDLDAAAAHRDRAVASAQSAVAAAQRSAIAAAQDRERARAAAARLEDGRAQHAKLADLESESRHRSRAADLLSEFRNTVVSSVGPRLALQAADLFGELTDHEYESIDVDPDTYQLQISDGGRLYGLDRFSGSEIDLANLALRVAISEHIHFQSGGSVGLLVLDEVFGPLDEDRKARMLLALERLKGRFRQVLVVTHDSEIKEQMPGAVEVVKLPGRRATARVIGD
ncbi:MAG TPA: SMC family ATPase [Acidimicrobiales bacterium]|nr:SMC family ATPase [Acidimicrobiales bacterium]